MPETNYLVISESVNNMEYHDGYRCIDLYLYIYIIYTDLYLV